MTLRAIMETKSMGVGILATTLFFGGVFYVVSYTNPTEKGHTIELRDDGFYPQELIIRKGEMVTFITTQDNFFWPASNLHPYHTIYPEFDPKEPIKPNNSWSFRFDRAGKWKYHDHLAPIYKGKIIVFERGNEGAARKEYNCEGTRNEKWCWEEEQMKR